jgi:hypothetical protein
VGSLMRIYIAVAVFAFGVWCYAVAALLFDRRRVLRNWQAGRRARASGGVQVAVVQAVSVRPLYPDDRRLPGRRHRVDARFVPGPDPVVKDSAACVYIWVPTTPATN